MIQSPTIEALAEALAKAQAEFTAIPKDSDNPFFKSRYAGLPAVVEKASPILAKHGLSVSQHLGHDERGDTLTTLLLHSSGQYLGDTMQLRPVKNDPQAHGSATTYGRRYAYMAALSLVADDDDDGNAGSDAASKPSSRSKPASKGNARGKSTQAPSGPQEASGAGPDGNGPATPEALKEIGRLCKGLDLDAVALRDVLTEAGVPEDKGTRDLTEDQATWVVIKLRERGK